MGGDLQNRLSPALWEFVREANIAVLATIRSDGSPHQTAVWYLFDGDEVKISITDRREKYRNVSRDPRVSLAIVSPTSPPKEVILAGTIRVTSEGGHELFRRLAVRYYGEVSGNKYADYSRDIAKDNRLILSFQAERVAAWDFAVEDDHHRPWNRRFIR